MTLTKPKFWDKKFSFFSIILIPLSLIFLLIIFFRKKLSIVKSFNIPVICVGNIYIGGTGKTPTSILLATEIAKLGRKAAILRKHYLSHEDEYNLIKKKFNNLIICKNRKNGIREAEKLKYDTVILDDGLQDYKIKKDLKIVCFNNNQLVGNGFVLPAGPLRENLNSLKNADIVIINGEKNQIFEEKILNINKELEVFYSYYRPINIEQFKNKKLLAFAGIGNPENFFQILEKNDLRVEKKIIFPDHYNFTENDVKKMIQEAETKNLQIIMTEKDYLKIKNFNFYNIQYLKVSLEIKNQSKLIKTIEKLYA